MFKEKMLDFLMQKAFLFKYFFRLMMFIFLVIGFFYFSLALNVFLQIKESDKFSTQHINFKKKISNKYIYEKDIYFTPPMATFLTNGSGLYVYISDLIFKEIKSKNLHIKVIRENIGEIKIYDFAYSDSEKAVQHFQHPGFHCLIFSPGIKFHIDFNNIKCVISGIDIPNPDKNIKIMFNFSGIKRRTIYLKYLVYGVLSIAGYTSVFLLYFFLGKLCSKVTYDGAIT